MPTASNPYSGIIRDSDWNLIVSNSQKKNLDPLLVGAIVAQESFGDAGR
jgi:hypothetical protein